MARATTRWIFGFVAACLTAILFVSGANAAVVVGNFGVLQPNDSDSFSQFSTNSAQLAAGEIIEFAVNTQASIDAAATTINLGSNVGISGFTVSLIENTGGNFASFDTLAIGSFSGGLLALSYAGLASGTQYGLLFSGVITGILGGAYAGTYAISSVPLPPAIWLFLSALVGLAGVVRHKRKRTTAVRPKKVSATA